MDMQQLFFEFLPFFISQQVYLSAIFSGKVLANILTDLSNDIHEEVSMHMVKTKSSIYNLSKLRDKVKWWQMTHLKIIEYNEKLNVCYTEILFLVYCFDFVVLVSAVSRIASTAYDGNPFSQSQNAIAFFIALKFTAQITLFAVPFVQVYEKVI